MSLCLCVCPLPLQFFSRPLIGQPVTLSVPRPLIGPYLKASQWPTKVTLLVPVPLTLYFVLVIYYSVVLLVFRFGLLNGTISFIVWKQIVVTFSFFMFNVLFCPVKGTVLQNSFNPKSGHIGYIYLRKKRWFT